MIKISVLGLLGVAAVAAGGGLMALEEIEAKVCCVAETTVSKESAAGKDSAAAKSAPLVCTLTDEALRMRKDEVRELLSKVARSVTEIETGYTVEFENGHGREIVEFIELERECCSFFEFALHFGAEQGPTTLTITGPVGVKDFLRGMFDVEVAEQS